MSTPPVYECKLSVELQEKARRELNETQESRTIGLKKLFEMVRSRPDITCPTDAVFLLGFLRARKFNIDRACKLLENWCKMRTSIPEVFSNYRPSDLKELIESGVCVMLESRDNEGRSVIVERPGNWDVKKYSAWDITKIEMMMCDLHLRNEETQINGIVDIFDMEGFGLHHMTQFGPRFLIRTAPIMNADTLPLRVKGIHVVNESGLFDGLYAMIKPFLKEKMRKRFHVHSSDLTQLHEQLPSHILPTEYGGSHRDSLESIVRNWTDDLLSKEELFVSMEAYGIKETELTKKSVDDADTMAGLAGTYKKLDT